MELQNGAVIRKRLFKVGYIDILLHRGFVGVIKIWSYLKYRKF